MRLTTMGWVLIAGVVATVVMALVAPGIAIVMAAILAVVAFALLADGMGANAGWFDAGISSSRKREALARRFKGGRPKWETTPPDHADEAADVVWERERKRRGLA